MTGMATCQTCGFQTEDPQIMLAHLSAHKDKQLEPVKPRRDPMPAVLIGLGVFVLGGLFVGAFMLLGGPPDVTHKVALDSATSTTVGSTTTTSNTPLATPAVTTASNDAPIPFVSKAAAQEAQQTGTSFATAPAVGVIPPGATVPIPPATTTRPPATTVTTAPPTTTKAPVTTTTVAPTTTTTRPPVTTTIPPTTTTVAPTTTTVPPTTTIPPTTTTAPIPTTTT